MAAFTAVMTFDIYKFGDKMKKLPNGDDEFHWAGKTVLFMVGGWIWRGWLLVRPRMKTPPHADPDKLQRYEKLVANNPRAELKCARCPTPHKRFLKKYKRSCARPTESSKGNMSKYRTPCWRRRRS
jgi:hypothetical protein